MILCNLVFAAAAVIFRAEDTGTVPPYYVVNISDYMASYPKKK
jgi:hypothetical protein